MILFILFLGMLLVLVTYYEGVVNQKEIRIAALEHKVRILEDYVP